MIGALLFLLVILLGLGTFDAPAWLYLLVLVIWYLVLPPEYDLAVWLKKQFRS